VPRLFKGGVFPDDKKKETCRKKIEPLPPPERLILPLSMHIGVPCQPLVHEGQVVQAGQMIADSYETLSAPIHSPVSGHVEAIAPMPHPGGGVMGAIVLRNDGKNRLAPTVHPYGSVESLTADQLLQIIRDSGIVGLGGAAFPTHVKIKAAQGRCDTVIINGAECEPYITSDHRVMLETPEEIIGGLRILMKLLSPKRAAIAVEANKRDAFYSLSRTLPGRTNIELHSLQTRYPQGSEKQLIRTIAGIEVPPGKLPGDVGCAVFNVATASAIHKAVTTGIPMIRRAVTVSGGAVSNPKNLLVPIGTLLSDIFNATGGFRETPHKILTGGPMMGLAQHNLDIPLTKSCGAVLAFSHADIDPQSPSGTCIRCGKCVSVCPMGLLPAYLYLYERKNKLNELRKLNISDCNECGSCAYICPGRLYLVHSIRAGKSRVKHIPDDQSKRGGARLEK